MHVSMGPQGFRRVVTSNVVTSSTGKQLEAVKVGKKSNYIKRLVIFGVSHCFYSATPSDVNTISKTTLQQLLLLLL